MSRLYGGTAAKSGSVFQTAVTLNGTTPVCTRYDRGPKIGKHGSKSLDQKYAPGMTRCIPG